MKLTPSGSLIGLTQPTHRRNTMRSHRSIQSTVYPAHMMPYNDWRIWLDRVVNPHLQPIDFTQKLGLWVVRGR